MKTQIRLASSPNEAKEALTLLGAHRKPGERAEPLPYKQLLLPNSYLIVAVTNGRVEGTTALYTESPLGLPLEIAQDINTYREHVGGRLAELDPACLRDENSNAELKNALLQFALYFGTVYCRCNAFLTRASKQQARDFAGFTPILPNHDSEFQVLALPSGEASLDKKKFDFVFPEKSDFLNIYQYKHPETIKLLLRQKPGLLDKLASPEMNYMRNVFAFSPYKDLVPEITAKYPVTMQHPRFPLHCEGTLKGSAGIPMDVVVQDISRLGLKLQVSDGVREGEIVAITLSVGIVKQTEVIGRVVWCDEERGVAGIEVKSGDSAWDQLLEHMDNCFKNEVA